MYATNVRESLDGGKSHDHLDSRAVRIGYDAAWCAERIFGIDLRHDQRYIVVHTEATRIVNHQRAVLGYRLGKLARNAATGRYECDIDTLEIVVVLQLFYLNLLSSECARLAGTASRAKEQQLVARKVMLFENLQKLLSYGATCANYC